MQNKVEFNSQVVVTSKLASYIGVPEEFHAVLQNLSYFPECVVFDLDDTLWYGDVEYTNGAPFTALKSQQNGCSYSPPVQKILDNRNVPFELFPNVSNIFSWLHAHGGRLAIASRTSTPRWADEALSLFEGPAGVTLNSLLEAKECYLACKSNHFRAISKNMNVSFDKMLFFDNEQMNINVAQSLGVCSVFTEYGLNWERFVRGLVLYDNFRCGETPDRSSAVHGQRTGGIRVVA
jgi:magnesium-dependent phosphatase-1